MLVQSIGDNRSCKESVGGSGRPPAVGTTSALLTLLAVGRAKKCGEIGCHFREFDLIRVEKCGRIKLSHDGFTFSFSTSRLRRCQFTASVFR